MPSLQQMERFLDDVLHPRSDQSTRLDLKAETRARAIHNLVHQTNGNPDTPCTVFASNALQDGWGLSDFQGLPNVAGIYRHRLSNPKQWRLIGSADNRAALREAQDKANQGYPVVAILLGADEHIALIIPGHMRRRRGPRFRRLPESPLIAQWHLNALRRGGNPSFICFGKPLIGYAYKGTDARRVKLFYRVLSG